MAVCVNPTIFLRGINPVQVLSDYKNGFYSREIVAKTKIVPSESHQILAQVYSSDHESGVFCVKDKNNSDVIIATTGNVNYQLCRGQDFDNTKCGGRCDSCKRDFTHQVVGYPIDYEEVTIPVTGSDGKTRYRVFYLFHVEGEFCSFGCALYFIKRAMARPSSYRDSSLSDCERWLHLLYNLMHPTAGRLKPANNPQLLTANGGSIDPKDWEEKCFVPIGRVVINPIRREHLLQRLESR